jgi:hypothetical protein
MVYSLCAFRTTASSPCTPDHYIGIVLFDGRCEVADICIFYALHDGFGSKCFQFRNLRLLANDGVYGVRGSNQLGRQVSCDLV